jgi:hypothetical protein
VSVAVDMYADDIAEMHEAFDAHQIRLAHALALLAAAERWRRERVEALLAVEARLEVALDDAVAAHLAADEAAGVVLDACRLVTHVRGER